jgi:hypothetical protein
MQGAFAPRKICDTPRGDTCAGPAIRRTPPEGRYMNAATALVATAMPTVSPPLASKDQCTPR